MPLTRSWLFDCIIKRKGAGRESLDLKLKESLILERENNGALSIAVSHKS
jgi:hypothetical protein